MELKTIENLLNEIDYLKQSHQMLDDICLYLNPYDRQINGKDCGDLARRVHEHLSNFDDNE